MEGWIKLHRAIQDNPLWRSEPFSRGQAWVDLLLLANHKESFFYKRGNKVTVLRGQVGRSEVELSDRWKWSRTKVRKFLTELQEEQQIKIHKNRVTQVLTIVNYDEYQQKEQQKDNRKTTEEQQKDTYKNDKNNKNDKKDSFKKEEEEKKQLLQKLQKLEAENKTLKSKVAEKRKKVAPKKEKSILENVKRPKNFTDEIWNLFALFVQMRKEIKKPYKSQTSIQTKVNSLSADIKEHGEEKVIAAINLSLEHQYQGIKVSWLKNSNNDKNHQNKSKQGNTDTQGDKNIFELFEQGINGNPFDVTESDLDFELPEQEY